MPAAKPETRYDVFISYRRGAADELALLLQRELQRSGLTAFLDRDLQRGVFDEMLLHHIAESTTFLVILTPNSLDRCTDQEDWLRKEIIQAIEKRRNIIPLRIDSFQFTSEVVRSLDPAIREISRYQAVEYSRTYFESTIERIVKIVQEDKAERKAEQEAAEERRLAAKRAEVEKREPEKHEAEWTAHQRMQIQAQQSWEERKQLIGQKTHRERLGTGRTGKQERDGIESVTTKDITRADRALSSSRALRMITLPVVLSVTAVTSFVLVDMFFQFYKSGHAQERRTPQLMPDQNAGDVGTIKKGEPRPESNPSQGNSSINSGTMKEGVPKPQSSPTDATAAIAGTFANDLSACSLSIGRVDPIRWKCIKRTGLGMTGLVLAHDKGIAKEKGYTVTWHFDSKTQELFVQFTDTPRSMSCGTVYSAMWKALKPCHVP